MARRLALTATTQNSQIKKKSTEVRNIHSAVTF
jgi:hypothetical protein